MYYEVLYCWLLLSHSVGVAVGGRDVALFLFRALGKVLYCKRKRLVGWQCSLYSDFLPLLAMFVSFSALPCKVLKVAGNGSPSIALSLHSFLRVCFVNFIQETLQHQVMPPFFHLIFNIIPDSPSLSKLRLDPFI